MDLNTNADTVIYTYEDIVTNRPTNTSTHTHTRARAHIEADRQTLSFSHTNILFFSKVGRLHKTPFNEAQFCQNSWVTDETFDSYSVYTSALCI